MPRYTYDCSACNKQFDISHGMFHEQNQCIECKRIDTLTKIPSFRLKRNTGPVDGPQAPVGKVVDEFIKDAKKDLKQQRKDLKTEYEGK